MTQAQTPRLAIIGCGSVVAHHLLPALLRIGWRPTVLVDRSRANCEKLLAQLGRRAQVTIAVAFACPFEGMTPVARVAEIARQLAAAGAPEIALADTIGVATPGEVSALIAAVKAALAAA